MMLKLFRSFFYLILFSFSNQSYADKYYDEIYTSDTVVIAERHNKTIWHSLENYNFRYWKDDDEIIVIDFYENGKRLAKIINLRLNEYIYAKEDKYCLLEYDENSVPFIECYTPYGS
ncbi:hypothetical protein NYR60_06710 [Actinobacillus genomosp. 2]|uniref:hypothetical protein n=1 Tax=Actinobacillus genomosp. 2 TaxID=230709 RepID=UPI00244171DD|nr:hypothetical protein [Actinobacillus genomosp. 2]WGE31549.1 hypothetical protein NYR60_06710 [Actinobacillus genomosp. 2]